MRLARTLVLIMLSLILCGRVARCETPSTPAELQQTISDGIKMLEAKQYGPFLKRMVAPKDREQLPIDTDDFIKHFGETKAPALLKVLKYIKSQGPAMSDDGAVATYALDKIPDGPNERPIIFHKYEDGLWYIDN